MPVETLIGEKPGIRLAGPIGRKAGGGCAQPALTAGRGLGPVAGHGVHRRRVWCTGAANLCNDHLHKNVDEVPHYVWDAI